MFNVKRFVKDERRNAEPKLYHSVLRWVCTSKINLRDFIERNIKLKHKHTNIAYTHLKLNILLVIQTFAFYVSFNKVDLSGHVLQKTWKCYMQPNTQKKKYTWKFWLKFRLNTRKTLRCVGVLLICETYIIRNEHLCKLQFATPNYLFWKHICGSKVSKHTSF